MSASRFFDAVASRYDRAYALPADESRRRMARVIGELPIASRLLDLGVGTGRELSALLDAGHTPVGVDLSPRMLERCARRSRPVRLVQADFWAPLAFDDASFDAALALHGTLAHPPDGGALARLSAEIARVVRSGGVWIAEAPSPSWLACGAGVPAHPAGDVRAAGSDRAFVYTDGALGVSIEGRVLSDAEWREALGTEWETRVEPLGELEWFIVARRL